MHLFSENSLFCLYRFHCSNVCYQYLTMFFNRPNNTIQQKDIMGMVAKILRICTNNFRIISRFRQQGVRNFRFNFNWGPLSAASVYLTASNWLFSIETGRQLSRGEGTIAIPQRHQSSQLLFITTILHTYRLGYHVFNNLVLPGRLMVAKFYSKTRL